MPRKQKTSARLVRAVSSVKRVLKRSKPKNEISPDDSTMRMKASRKRTETTRPPRREPDIPLELLAKTYTPSQTSLKSSFRASGADQQRDQEFARGVSDDRFNDEDEYTNKSGDPRIGTHGRTYEPGERKTSTRGERNG